MINGMMWVRGAALAAVFAVSLAQSASAIPPGGTGKREGAGALGFPDPGNTAFRISTVLANQGHSAGKPSNESAIPRDPRFGTPVFMDRDAMDSLARISGKSAGATAADRARAVIAANPAVFHIDNPTTELVLETVATDDLGFSHCVFNQVYRGVPLLNQQITVHFDRSGEPYAFNGRYTPTPPGLAIEPVMSEQEAVNAALADLPSAAKISEIPPFIADLLDWTEPQVELVIVRDDAAGAHKLAWKVECRPNAAEIAQYLYDARDGTLIERFIYSQTATVTTTAADYFGAARTFPVTIATGGYNLADETTSVSTYDAHGIPITTAAQPHLISSPTNIWPDSLAVSAYSNVLETYAYFIDSFGRRGVDNAYVSVPVIVHYTDNGTPYLNAFWNGNFIAFGDGLPFAAAKDVVAHEITHGVTQYTVGLQYSFQSGALNESFSDVFACMVDPDWTMGEDLPGGPIRSLADPNAYGQPADMSHYQNLPLSQDNGGVHVNMEIPGHAFYLIAQDIGSQKAAAVWYRVLAARYLTPTAQFADLRLGALQSAIDLYGDNSPEWSAVGAGFDAVQIIGSATPEPPDHLPLPGETWIATVDGAVGDKLALRPLDGGNPWYPSQTAVTTSSACPITVGEDISKLMFVDFLNNLRQIDLQNGQETLLDNSRDWSSVSLSPDGTLLAATSIFADSTIYVFNLDNPNASVSYKLITPAADGAGTNTALYADALDWTTDGSAILCDVYNELPVNGSVISFWDICELDLATGTLVRITIPLPTGTQTGNPSFAETNDCYIVCDAFSPDTGSAAIVTLDLFTMDYVRVKETGTIAGGYPNVGIPRYSPDDSYIVYQRYSDSTGLYTTLRQGIASDHLTPQGAETVIFEDAATPVPFVRTAPADVAEQPSPRPEPITLLPNYPNPFNPRTVIPFSIREPGLVRVTVFDILGRPVATLADGRLPAGRHEVTFDGTSCGSGVYFYRIESKGASKIGRMLLLK